ncbi:hypothetical protein I6N96_03255 [Enterococcus sp. BWM-S5]|uniref:Uncharacterized protein n=1 Tax=Enterococcus larvae TaxID=2794352 RepID=A0ABS4CGJ6_9ENTE|nr:hypothetical protein [Enterococcus larvae]MBP1045281.1 hypothetical protein [Enterococcus larvae]
MMITGEDTGRIEAILLKPPENRLSMERRSLADFSKRMYAMYVGIRDVLTDNHCRGLGIMEVRKRMNMNKLQEYFPYTEAEIDYCLSFVDQHIKIVR